MPFHISLSDEILSDDHRTFLQTCAKACRSTILRMVTNAQSGHPGGSLSSIDYLVLLYSLIISRTGEPVVVSNGHISPAVYAILAEMGYVDKEDVIKNFRQFGSIFEGHVSRHVPGVWFGTGPLGVGVSAACGFAYAEKLKKSGKRVYAVMGDGETQEGQVHEMMQFAAQHKLDNLILFVDYNRVQLTASLKEIEDIDIPAVFRAAKWNVLEVDGHDFDALWQGLRSANETSGKPTVIIGKTIMGKGVEFMEENGRALKSDWHGKAPSKEQTAEALPALTLSDDEEQLLDKFRKTIVWCPPKPSVPVALQETGIDPGTAKLYDADTITDCRSAYGTALLDLAKRNPDVVALTADLKGSVKTDGVSRELPDQYIECGIAEQHMVSVAGGMSLDDFTPFVSTFGAFMTSRAKDQARVNDINNCNVKMVATHCGLSVGEDGPTHQAIDDMGSFLGLFNTMIIEPADPNHTDRIIRYIASHYGNFYVRMGRHKVPVLTKEDGTLFYDEKYEYLYGSVDRIREGSDITIVASGTMIHEVMKAKELAPNISMDILVASSIKQFDETLKESLTKTGKVITVEDHNTLSGLGGQVAKYIAEQGIRTDVCIMLGVPEYQLSGTPELLYRNVGIDAENIATVCKKACTK